MEDFLHPYVPNGIIEDSINSLDAIATELGYLGYTKESAMDIFYAASYPFYYLLGANILEETKSPEKTRDIANKCLDDFNNYFSSLRLESKEDIVLALQNLEQKTNEYFTSMQ